MKWIDTNPSLILCKLKLKGKSNFTTSYHSLPYTTSYPNYHSKPYHTLPYTIVHHHARIYYIIHHTIFYIAVLHPKYNLPCIIPYKGHHNMSYHILQFFQTFILDSVKWSVRLEILLMKCGH